MTPEMATIDRLDVALQILPLLSGEIAIDRFILEKPVINLEVDEQGRPNWQLGTAEAAPAPSGDAGRSEEHTSELQSLMRISYAVFCLKKQKQNNNKQYE